MGFWSSLASIALPGVGSYLQSKAQNDASKRSYEVDLKRLGLDANQQNFTQQLMQREEGRTGASDAWRKFLAAAYAQNRGPQPHLSPYSVGSRPLEGLSIGADPLMQEVLARLQGGNPVTATPFDPLASPQKTPSGWGGMFQRMKAQVQ